MRSKYTEGAEYHLVEGWYTDSDGLCDHEFYGAAYYPDNPLTAVRVVLEGSDAVWASEEASKRPVLQYGMVSETKTQEDAVERDEEETIIEEPESDAAPSKGHKNVNKGKDKEGVGDLKSEDINSKLPEVENLSDVAMPENPEPKPNKNLKALTDFWRAMSGAIGNIEKAGGAIMQFGVDTEMHAKIQEVHQYLLKLRQVFMETKGAELAAAGIDLATKFEGTENNDETISEMATTSGAIAAFPGSKGGVKNNSGMPKDTKGFTTIDKKEKKRKKVTTKEEVEGDPLKFAQPNEKALGMPDRGQGQGNNNIEGFNTRRTRRMNEDIQGDVKITTPDKLATIDVKPEITEKTVEEGKKKKKLKKAVPPRGTTTPRLASVGSVQTGRFESVEIGDRIVITDTVNEEFKHMVGLRGKVVKINNTSNPVVVKLDESTFGNEHGLINVRLQEISIISEDKNPRLSESLELAWWIAGKRGINNETIVAALGKEIMEWADTNAIKELMPIKHDILPVFSTLLEQIANDHN